MQCYVIGSWDKQIQLKKTMHKGTLVDILFESPENAGKAVRGSRVEREQRECSQRQCENAFRKAQSSSRGSNMIKITQFNSSLVIGEEKVHRRTAPLSSSSSPTKNFTIKKVADLKSKVAVTAQKIIEMELRKRDRAHMQLHGSFTHDSAKPIQKILVTTRCNIKNQAPNIQSLTCGISIDGDLLLMGERGIDESLSQFLNSQRRELKQSKEMLGITNKSSRCPSKNNGSEKKLDFEHFADKMDDFEALARKNTGSPRRHYSRHIQEQKKYQELIEKQKREMLELKKQLNKNYAKPFNPPENISAYSFIVYQADAKKSKFLRKLSSLKREDNPEANQTRKTLLNSHKVVVANNSRSAVQIASLTKIMTCILTLDLAKKHSVNLSEELVTIGTFEQNIGGTSANIQKGQIYSIEQLLHGLMLPSGNDASLALAVWAGKLLLHKQTARKEVLASTACSEAALSSFKKRDCYERFIVEMNSKAAELNMQKTKYANSHGLSNFQNKSCAFDLALLCEYAMNNKQFREIVSCKVYQAVINIENEDITTSNPSTVPQEHVELPQHSDSSSVSEGIFQSEQMKDMEEVNESYNDELAEDRNKDGSLRKAIRWENTHQLLQAKPNLYVGIKTGITNTAGPCLASCLEISGKRYIVIVLNCKSMKYRFKDTENLRKWLFNKEEIKYREEGKPSERIQLLCERNMQMSEQFAADI